MLTYIALSGLLRFIKNVSILKALKGRCMLAWGKTLWNKSK
jgi:hypothetical protein